MDITRSRRFIIAGTAAGIILIVSCSDDAPGSVDAATCNCPAAEPPLAGRIRQVTRSLEIGPNSTGLHSADCELGAQVLGGGCAGPEGIIKDIVIRQTRPSGGNVPGWSCDVRNNEPTPVTMQVMAFCLTPATN